MKYVIIGNSTAAIGCVEGIRSQDKKGQIVIISKEKHHTYSRPLISYLLCGKTTLEKMKYRPDDFYNINGVETHFGDTVKSIDKDKKVVITEHGQYSYDKLMIAAGSEPFVPNAEGLNDTGYYTFGSLDDALSLDRAATSKSRVLIIGAGLIGLKCAEGIYGKAAKITVVDMADRVLSSILDDRGSEIVGQHLRSKGIEIFLGKSVKKYQKNVAEMSDGTTIDFDVLVIAVGVRPNTALAAGIGAAVNRGIVTCDKGMTTVDDVYAAGDCSESYDISSCANKILALLPNAYFQGHRSGVCMAGGCEQFDNAIPMNSLGLFGLHMVTAGCYSGDAHVTENNGTYKKLITKDNRLVGYIIIGDIERAGIYTGLIRNKVPLDTVDFELVSIKPQLMAYTRTERQKQLGGAKK